MSAPAWGAGALADGGRISRQLSTDGPNALAAQRWRVGEYCCRAQSTSSGGAAARSAWSPLDAACQGDKRNTDAADSPAIQSSKARPPSTLRELAARPIACGSG